MATVALIQKLFHVLNEKNLNHLSGFSRQVYEKFFEVLEDESGHSIQRAESLEEYQAGGYDKPDIVICAPFPEIGNLAPGFAELERIRAFFGAETPIIIWSPRNETALRQRVLEEFGAAAFYTGTLLDAPNDFADMILELL